jgi:hypothetical protein
MFVCVKYSSFIRHDTVSCVVLIPALFVGFQWLLFSGCVLSDLASHCSGFTFTIFFLLFEVSESSFII